MEGTGSRRHRVAIVGGGGPSERVITAQQVFGRHAIEAQAAVAGSVPARTRTTAV